MDQKLWMAADSLLTLGLPEEVPRELSEEDPYIPLGLDIDQDLAVAAFLCWQVPKNEPVASLQMVTLSYDQDDWNITGGATGPLLEYPLNSRGPVNSHQVLMHILLHVSESSASRSQHPSGTVLRVPAEVDRVTVGGRILQVPFHGYLAIAIHGRKSAIVTAIDMDGSELGTLDLNRRVDKLIVEQSRALRDRPHDIGPDL